MSGNIEECLKKFIHHVDNLCKEDDPAGNGFWREFRELREIQQENKAENKFPAEEGKKECNIKKNRYKDIIPFDTQRVVLSLKNGEEGTDYINASYILDTNREKSYIASQGPLPHTVNDFWRMLWEQKVEIVFMVCREEENGRNKCQRYWAEEGEMKKFGDIEVTLESKEEIFPDFLERRICAKCGDQIHRVKQFHYTGWPDHGIPRNSKEIYNMVGKMREERRQLKIPLVIHCSAGCGRTGTICAVDYAWTMLDQGKIAHGFSMFEIIKNIREQRQSMVQTPDQYEFVHLVVQSLCADWLEKFQEHDYANFNFDTEEGQTDEVYYNTTGLYDNSASSDDVYQEVTTIEPSSQSNTAKKPQPTPRPQNLLVEVNNNDQKNDNITKPKENNENVKATTKKLAPLKQSPVAQTKLPNRNTPRKNTPESSSAGHKTKILVVGAQAPKQAAPKQPPAFTPSSPSATHANAVKNRTLAAVKMTCPKEGTVQQTAKSKVNTSSTSQDQPSSSEGEYGIVMKQFKTSRLGSYPEASSQLVVGNVARENNRRISQQIANNIQSYENFQPLSSIQTYENFVPLLTKEPNDRAPQSAQGDAPVLPSRNYDPEEATNTSPHKPGTVSAIGGIPQSSATMPASNFSSGGVYSEIGPVTSHYPTNTHQGNMTNASNKGGMIDKFKGMIGRGKPVQSSKNEENTNGHFFKNHNPGFNHRVFKPKGPRKPVEGTWSTRL